MIFNFIKVIINNSIYLKVELNQTKINKCMSKYTLIFNFEILRIWRVCVTPRKMAC